MKNYQKKAKVTLMEFASTREALSYLAIGLGGEVGEVLEPIKKHLHHGKALDIFEMEKELGDVLWYLTMIAEELGLSLDNIAKKNIEKLTKRHNGKFKKDY